MAFGVYVHIPYCLQKCVYCDFATYEISQSESLPPTEYVNRVKKEIELKGPVVGPRKVDSVYFGGGTPSLLKPELLIEIVNALKENGFLPQKGAELTLEINPGTLSERDIDQLLEGGFNRFSVGAQSFVDRLLDMSHRKHTSQDTRDTLRILNQRKINFSLDILFSLPTQTFDELQGDVEEALSFEPAHVSPYWLDVPENHSFMKNRALEEDQIKMFEHLDTQLTQAGIRRYEISNFAKPGFESRHNLLYWQDQEYWGIGLSSHSYFHKKEWGLRCWNPKGMKPYFNHVEQLAQGLPTATPWFDQLNNAENLTRKQAMTDYFHTSLRQMAGLNEAQFKAKFSQNLEQAAGESIEKLKQRGLVNFSEGHLRLSKQGILLSNVVFEEFTF